MEKVPLAFCLALCNFKDESRIAEDGTEREWYVRMRYDKEVRTGEDEEARFPFGGASLLFESGNMRDVRLARGRGLRVGAE